VYIAITVPVVPPSEISGPPGGHLPRHGPPGERRRHAEQHARVRLRVPGPDGRGRVRGGQVRQQAGVPVPGLRHHLHRLHLRRGPQVPDAPPRVPVSLEEHVTGSELGATDSVLKER